MNRPPSRLAPVRLVSAAASFLFALQIALSGLPLPRSAAADWPQWRGPRRDAVSRESGLLKHWPPAGPKLTWRAAGLGTGYSSIVVSDGRVFTIGRRGDDVVCVALDERTGDLRWSRKIGQTSRIPCSTPTVDGDRVYALDPDGDLVCLRVESGELLWQRSFLDDFGGRMMSGRGYGESPLVDGAALVCTPGGAESLLVKLDKRSGKTLWKARTPELGMAGRDGAGFSSIVVSQAARVRQYVQLVGRGLVGVAADDGRVLWHYNRLASATANIPTPLVRDNFVFAANGYNTGSALLRLERSDAGGVAAHEVYFLRGNRFQNHHGGVMLVGDHVFGGHGSNNGLPTCLELKSGKIRWKRRGPGVGSAAVVYADGHLYFRYQNGLVALIEADPKRYRLKGSFSLPGAGGDSWSHPVVANGRLYLREQSHLWVYDIVDRGQFATNAKQLAGQPQGPVVDQIRQRHAIVERLEDQHPLYSIVDQTRSERPAVLVTLANRHLDDSGDIRAELIELCEQLKRPLVVSVAGTRCSDSAPARLARMPNLIGLNLELCGQVSDGALARLEPARRLQVLVLTGTQVGDRGLPQLSRLAGLRGLDLEVCEQVTAAGCQALGDLKQLEALILKKTGFEKQGIGDDGLAGLQQLQRLRWLDLYGSKVTDQGLAHLATLTRLERLDLSLTPITDAGVARLAELNNLRELNLLFSTGFAGPQVGDPSAESLAQLHQLRSLNLVGSRLTDAGLRQLGQLTRLEQLDLVGSPVTAAGIRDFKKSLPRCELRK